MPVDQTPQLMTPPTFDPVTDQDLYKVIGAQYVRILSLEQYVQQLVQMLQQHTCEAPEES